MVQNNSKECTKKRAVLAKLLFSLIRPIAIFHRSPALPSRLALHDFIFCLNKPGVDLGEGAGGAHPSPPPPEMTCGFLIQLVFCKKKLCGLLLSK